MHSMMNERRRERRLPDCNEITLSVFPGEKKLPAGKILSNYSEDLSESGARIFTDRFLPVGSLLRIEMKLKYLHQVITTPGKVKWIKIISSGGSCEAGVEFINIPKKVMKTLDRYISWIGMLYPARIHV